MPSMKHRAGRALESASEAGASLVDSAASAGSAFVDALGGLADLAGFGNGAAAESASGGGSGGGWGLPTLSTLFGGGAEGPSVEAEPTFGSIHDQTDHLVREVDTAPAARTPYGQALDAYAAGDIDGTIAAFHRMKPDGRERLARSRPEILGALVSAGDSLAVALDQDLWTREVERQLTNALVRAELRSDAVADTAWARYAESRDDKWFARMAVGARVVLPPATETLDIDGVSVTIGVRASGTVDFVNRDDRFGEVEVQALLACAAEVTANLDGRAASQPASFTKRGVVGRGVDGPFSGTEPAADWSVG